MAEAKEKAAKNSPVAQEENSEIKKTKKLKKEEAVPTTSTSSPLKSFVRFLKDERTHRVTGLVFLLFSLYLFIAQLSYIFTWKNDQDKVMGSWWQLLTDNQLKVENWLGKMGAIVSHQFIYNWFGISSFIFCYVFFLAGIRILLKRKILPFRKSLRISFFALLWISVTCSFIFTNPSYLYLGGSFGYFSNLWLSGILGTIGAGLFIVACAIAFLIVSNNLTFSPKVKSVETANNEPKIATEIKNNLPETEAETEPINVHKNIVERIKSKKNAPKIETEFTFSSTGLIPEVTDVPNKDFLELSLDENASLTATSQQKQVVEELTMEVVVPETSPTIETSIDNVPFVLEEKPITVTDEITAESIIAELPLEDYDPTLELSSFQFPPVELLEKHGSDTITINNEELQANKNKILETLKNYSIDIEKIKATIGPTVTLYEIIPAAGVRISKIKNLEDDIALSLSALGIRIIAPIPGKGTIGIEVPNQKPETVSMRSIIDSDKFKNSTFDLPIALGKTISNDIFITDLAKMPHLLMAGATGQGKSVGLNAILVSLLYKKHPSQLKFVLVDPKKVELTLFNTIERHYLAKLPDSAESIITDTKKVINTLNSLCIEMDQRYDLLKDAAVRNLKEYNAKFISRKLLPTNGHKFLPYIVLVVDEFADLIMTAGKEVETPIARLAQLARAIGIHLIIATQRPSVNIITGTIKANFPARIAFRVSSKIDSRTILDSGGADQLIGRGDMLLSTGNDLIRIQCAFVDTPEVDKITEFIGSQRGYPDAFLLPEYIDETATGGNEDFDPSERDALFAEAAKLIVQHQQGSTSLIQRRLKLGYNRAGRIIDQLEAAGVIGPFEGSKARQVLIRDENSLEQLLNP
ncbi:MAG: DNA translocase FtsK [Bacteroidia bacterium]|nr:DNA translocase FtsK [Bacteroidia bacterium]